MSRVDENGTVHPTDNDPWSVQAQTHLAFCRECNPYALPKQDKLEAIRALHHKTCEFSGDNCTQEDCEMTMCGPCGEPWPCETVVIIDG